jgi:hypothetical protein
MNYERHFQHMDMEKIEAQLKRLTPELSMHESQVLWSRVESRLSPRGAKSPKRSTKRRSLFRAITAGLVITGLLGGSVVTAYASEALPGDTLYPAKITLERVQITLAPDEKKKDLQLAFADRRIKEITAVLADVEEEPGMAEESMLMAVSAPAPEVATFALSMPAEGEVVSEQADLFATKSAPSTNDAPVPESEGASMARTAVMMDPPADVQAVALSETVVAPVQEEVKHGKRWKNLEKKKKALSAVIRELERSRKELEESGATSTSERVDEVIVNLTELNDTGTTLDDGFVERVKNSQVEVLTPRVEVESEPQEDEDSRENRGKRESFFQKIEPIDGAGAVILSDAGDVTPEVMKELQEVKQRNEERKKRISRDTKEEKTRGNRTGGDDESRVLICFQHNGEMRELEVRPRDLPRFEEGVVAKGPCPAPDATPGLELHGSEDAPHD